MRENQKLKILILGASGMLGSTLFREFSADENLVTFGTVRDASKARHFADELHDALIPNVHMDNESNLLGAFAIARPDVVINCIGIIKQLPNASNYLEALASNAVLPHRLSKYCSALGARLIHFSTDCVFSGKDGAYVEDDYADAQDLYGHTKLLGEVSYDNAVTLRTSMIGHELETAHSLVDWFLNQTDEIKGFRKAIFSGLPTIEIARILRKFVIPNRELSGLYHLSVAPISKFDLLKLVAETYKKEIVITPNDTLVLDRSLNSDRFLEATGYVPKPWPELVRDMYEDGLKQKKDAA